MRTPAMITDSSDLKHVRVEFKCPACDKIVVNHATMANIQANNNKLIGICSNCDTQYIKIRIKPPIEIKPKIVLTINDGSMSYTLKAFDFEGTTIATMKHYLDGFVVDPKPTPIDFNSTP